MQIKQHDDVDFDLTELATHYEREQPGLGERFLLEYGRAIDAIATNPLAWRAIREGVRRYLIRKFSVLVIYGVEEDAIKILVVVHASRSEASWLQRLDD